MKIAEKFAKEANKKYLEEWEEPRYDFEIGYLAGFLKARSLSLDLFVNSDHENLETKLKALGEQEAE